MDRRFAAATLLAVLGAVGVTAALAREAAPPITADRIRHVRVDERTALLSPRLGMMVRSIPPSECEPGAHRACWPHGGGPTAFQRGPSREQIVCVPRGD